MCNTVVSVCVCCNRGMIHAASDIPVIVSAVDSASDESVFTMGHNLIQKSLKYCKQIIVIVTGLYHYRRYMLNVKYRRVYYCCITTFLDGRFLRTLKSSAATSSYN